MSKEEKIKGNDIEKRKRKKKKKKEHWIFDYSRFQEILDT